MSADISSLDARRAAGWVLAIAVASLALSLFLTRGLTLVDRDEGRYAEASREMLVSGDWLVPRLFGVPYLEKPPLFYWLSAAALAVVGIDERGARFVPGASAALGVLATGLFALRMLGPGAAVLSSLVLATAALYFTLARIVLTDMLFALTISAALMAFFVAEEERRSLLPFWLFAAAATLTKGPVAGALCALAILAYCGSVGSLGTLFTARFWIGFPAYAAIVATWFGLVEVRFPGYLEFYVYKEHLLRVAGDEHREGPLWYLPWLLLGFLPWTPVLFAALPSIVRRLTEPTREGRTVRFAAIWALGVLVFFSLPRGKLVPYLLPMFPPLAVVLGDALARTWTGGHEIRGLRLSFASLGALFLAVAVAAPIAWEVTPLAMSPVLFLVGASAAAGALLIFRTLDAGDARPALAVAATVAAIELLVVPVARPIADRVTIGPIIRILRDAVGPDEPVVLYSGYFPNLPFYLGRIPYFVFGNRELDFGVSLEGNGPYVVDTLEQLRGRLGAHRTLYVLHPRTSDVNRLRRLPGRTRVLYTGRRSVLLEHQP